MSFKIEILFAGEWMELMGHGCYFLEEAKHYANTIDPTGKTIRIVEV